MTRRANFRGFTEPRAQGGGRGEHDRRKFLQLASGFCLLPLSTSACEARELIRNGSLGRVVFCRASQSTAAWTRYLLDGAAPVCERIDRDELVLCGTEATLVIDQSGYRRFA